MAINRSDKQKKSEAFSKDITAESKSYFEFFAFSNEYDFDETIKAIDSYSPIKTDKLRVAMLIGESNFISLLPELAKHADVVILNDINKNVHSHTTHLLNCLKKASDAESFLEFYQCEEHPLRHGEKWGRTRHNPNAQSASTMKAWHAFTVAELTDDLQNQKVALNDKLFISSPERFKACKEAAEKLVFVHSTTNLVSTDQCQKLANTLQKNEAIMTLINMTNAHDYDTHYIIPKTLTILLSSNHKTSTKDSTTDEPIILYSIGGTAIGTALTSKISDSKGYLHYLAQLHQIKIDAKRKKAKGERSILSIDKLYALFFKNYGQRDVANNQFMVDTIVSLLRKEKQLSLSLIKDIGNQLKESPDSQAFKKAHAILEVLLKMSHNNAWTNIDMEFTKIMRELCDQYITAQPSATQLKK